MIELASIHIVPAALALLPPAMNTIEARAMLIAIGNQESGFVARKQYAGPARGFWQFEPAGVSAVMTHDRTNFVIGQVLRTLSYDHLLDVGEIHASLEHNDILAACFARCLMWASSRALPSSDDAGAGWKLYVDAWRPGKPRPDAWQTFYRDAWARVLDRRKPPTMLRA